MARSAESPGGPCRSILLAGLLVFLAAPARTAGVAGHRGRGRGMLRRGTHGQPVGGAAAGGVSQTDPAERLGRVRRHRQGPRSQPVRLRHQRTLRPALRGVHPVGLAHRRLSRILVVRQGRGKRPLQTSGIVGQGPHRPRVDRPQAGRPGAVGRGGRRFRRGRRIRCC